MIRSLLIITTVCLCLINATSVSAQNRYDVVITEIMSDPTPQIGLPNFEWIEIRNTTSLPINLQNWRIFYYSPTVLPSSVVQLLLQPCSTTEEHLA